MIKGIKTVLLRPKGKRKDAVQPVAKTIEEELAGRNDKSNKNGSPPTKG